jgi:hypothetical protein
VTQESPVLAVIILLVFLILLLLFFQRVKAGHIPHLRRIQGFDLIKSFSSRTIETGRPLHISLGLGSTVNATTADSLAGLSTLKHLARQGAVAGVSPIVSLADPTVMLFAQNSLRAAHGEDIYGAQNALRQVRWIAPQPAAYAAGVMSLLNMDRVGANVMVGQFGDEYLLMGEAAVRDEIPHVGGTSNPNTLPYIYVSAQETLLGEEIYAAGAYLEQHPTHLGSLLAQDTLRWIVAGLMLGGVTLASLGWW